MDDRSTAFVCDKLSGNQLRFARGGDHGQMSLSQRSRLEEARSWKEVEVEAGVAEGDLDVWVAPRLLALEATASALVAGTASPIRLALRATTKSAPGVGPGWCESSFWVPVESGGLRPSARDLSPARWNRPSAVAVHSHAVGESEQGQW